MFFLSWCGSSIATSTSVKKSYAHGFRGKSMSLLVALINWVLGTSEDGHDFENVITEVQLLPLKDRALCIEEWLLQWFTIFNLVRRSEFLDSISTEDLSLISIMHQGVKINFDRFMIGKIRFVFVKIVKQKLLSVKQSIYLPFKKFICRILVALEVST